MYCPKCHYVMGRVEYGGITVDRCTNCKGIWFDHLEAEQLKRVKGANSIDVGREKTGKAYDSIKEVVCPHCNIRMATVAVPGTDHCTYESCGQCKGIFMDAGEFREFMTEKSILDFFRNLLPG